MIRRFRLFMSAKKSQPFVFTINTANTSTGSTTNTQFKLPLISTGTYDFTVDWGDSSSDAITTWNQAETTHTYASTSSYTVTISGTIEGWRFANTGDRLKILNIESWGPIKFQTELNTNNGCFFGCANLDVTAFDTPTFNSGVGLASFFRGCSNLEGNSSFNNWNVSGVISFNSMFLLASKFNQNIGNWDVGSATNFSSMFQVATLFNNGGSGDINNWDVSSSGTFTFMFQSTAFNQNIGNWDVSAATGFTAMFRNSPFNNGGSDSIKDWNVSSATTFGGSNSGIFALTPFNQPIGSWNVGNVTSFQETFRSNAAFNQDISGWNVSSGNNFRDMFFSASAFNQNISGWNVGAGTNFFSMFQSATAFNQPIGSWDVSNATTMQQMFQSATNFNQNIGSWNVAKVASFTAFMANKTSANYSAFNLDAIYNGWSALTFVNTGLTITFNTIKYTAAGQAGRDILTNAPNNWSITDGGI
jgi:surface protein